MMRDHPGRQPSAGLRFSDSSHARIETTVQSFLDDIATACGYGRSPSLVGIRL